MNSKELIGRLRMDGISDPRVLEAFAKVPRELFVREDLKDLAYEDEALPIDCGQTITQPYLVARMTELLLGGKKLKKVLEVGTGSGYQAAILAQLVDEVYTIERIQVLLDQAQHRFKLLGYHNIHTLYGDGYLGWVDHAPFDGIIVTAAASEIPYELRNQLVDSGRLVIPIGPQFGAQELCLVTRHQDQLEIQRHDFVVFVPMLHGKNNE